MATRMSPNKRLMSKTVVHSFGDILCLCPYQNFHVVFQRTAKKCTEIYNARAYLLFCSLNFLFSDVLVAVIVVDTLLQTHYCPWCFLGCANWETFVADTKCFRTKSETFFVSRTQNLCPQQMMRARANGETFVSATMCLQQCVLVERRRLMFCISIYNWMLHVITY